MIWDVAIVGGGPAGLATAIAVASKNLSVVVLERQHAPIDKACGEGLMPAGLAQLEALHVHVPPSETGRFTAIRWVQEDGRHVEAALPAPGGLGIRRLALHAALTKRARDLGVELLEGIAVHGHAQTAAHVELGTEAGPVTAKLLVAADGLHSPLRKALDLEAPPGGLRRFGLRQHFACKSWGERVEVHFAEGLEAYVTPAGANRIGVAFLWEDGAIPPPITFDAMLKRFPLLAELLAGAREDSKAIGAGPLQQNVRTTVKGRALLLGDAAGYVDAITGEGLSLAFEQAGLLASLLPGALTDLALLETYRRVSASSFNSYARLASSLVAMARRPALRRAAINRLAANPAVFGFLLRHLTKPRAARRP